MLKIIAIITMIIDHIGYLFLNNNIIFRTIGRISLPLFIYTFVQGCLKTTNEKKRITRLALTAIITEPIFDYVIFGTLWYPQYQNILITFAIAAISIMFLNNTERTTLDKAFIIVLTSITALILKIDYDIEAMISIYICYFLIKNNKPICFMFFSFIPFLIISIKNPVFILGYLASYVIILLLYSPKFNKKPQYKVVNILIQYCYPLHLIILELIAMIIEKHPL